MHPAAYAPQRSPYECCLRWRRQPSPPLAQQGQAGILRRSSSSLDSLAPSSWLLRTKNGDDLQGLRDIATSRSVRPTSPRYHSVAGPVGSPGASVSSWTWKQAVGVQQPQEAQEAPKTPHPAQAANAYASEWLAAAVVALPPAYRPPHRCPCYGTQHLECCSHVRGSRHAPLKRRMRAPLSRLLRPGPSGKPWSLNGEELLASRSQAG